MAQASIDLDGIGDLSGSPRRHRKERLVRGFFFGAALISIVISVAIVVSLLGRAVEFATSVDLGALWTTGWFPRRGLFDLRTVVIGTLIVSGVAMIVAAPLGLGAAVYLSEYAGPRVRRTLKPILEVLAGIPSVVVGYFAISFISPDLVQRFFSDATFFSMAAAGIGVGILVTPLVASVAEDAMRSVPLALREGAYGVGARKRSVTMKVVFPAAVSGIMAALIIGLSRAIGETMVVAMVAGASGGSPLELNPLHRGQTMTAAMASLAIGSDQVKGEANTFESLFFLGMLLFMLTFSLNALSERFVRKVRQRY